MNRFEFYRNDETELIIILLFSTGSHLYYTTQQLQYMQLKVIMNKRNIYIDLFVFAMMNISYIRSFHRNHLGDNDGEISSLDVWAMLS